MKQRIYLDINSGVGRMNYRNERIPYTTGTLLEEMMYYRVHASLVYSNSAKDYCFVKGNKELVEELKKSPRLFGIATVIPDIQYEVREGYAYYDKLLKEGIKAFKLYPKSLRHGFNPFYLENLAGYMIKKNLPLFIEQQETDWKELGELLKAFPELKFVLCNSSWGDNRYLFPAMISFANLYFDISSNQANDILDICKKHFDVRRMLFGTNYPYKVMGGLKSLIEYSDLSDEDKDKVAYKNAIDLLHISMADIKPYTEDECMLDEIALKMDEGMPLDDILVIDSHTHMVDREHYTTSLVPMLNGDEDNMIRKMDRLGIDRIITSPWEGIMTSGMNANETSLKAHKKYGDRIEAYATCNPHYEEDLNTVVDVYHDKYGFIGIKPYHPKHQYDLLGEKYRKWFEYGNSNRLIMLVHSGSKEVAEKISVLSEKYEDMNFILAHSGMSYQVADWNIEVANKRDNVYLEITYTSLTNGIIEYLVEKAGADKVLFGTDMPMRDPAPQLAWVAYARIQVKDKKKVLGENILKLIEETF